MRKSEIQKPKRLSKRQKADLENFAQACGITYAEALKVRDDLALVKLDLPRLGKSRR